MLIGYPGYPPTLCCPGKDAKQGLHFLLWDKLRMAADKSYPKSFLDELKAEVRELRRQFQHISPKIQGPVEEWKGVELEELIGQ